MSEGAKRHIERLEHEQDNYRRSAGSADPQIDWYVSGKPAFSQRRQVPRGQCKSAGKVGAELLGQLILAIVAGLLLVGLL